MSPQSTEVKKLAVIHHSANGHTEHIAKHVAEGARGVPHTEVYLLKAQSLAGTPDGAPVFAMQHGMVWVGNPVIPEQHFGVPYDEAANRLGSWSGLMAKAEHASRAEELAEATL